MCISVPIHIHTVSPDFLAPSTEQALAAIKMKEQMDCIDPTFEPRNNNGQPSSTITAGLIRTPLDPSLTHHEALMIHAEIKALVQQLGLRYKDAAHHLYMARVEQVKLADLAAKSFAMLKQKIDEMVSHELCPVIDAIDHWDLDNFTVKDGYWSNPTQLYSNIQPITLPSSAAMLVSDMPNLALQISSHKPLHPADENHSSLATIRNQYRLPYIWVVGSPGYEYLEENGCSLHVLHLDVFSARLYSPNWLYSTFQPITLPGLAAMLVSDMPNSALQISNHKPLHPADENHSSLATIRNQYRVPWSPGYGDFEENGCSLHVNHLAVFSARFNVMPELATTCCRSFQPITLAKSQLAGLAVMLLICCILNHMFSQTHPPPDYSLPSQNHRVFGGVHPNRATWLHCLTYVAAMHTWCTGIETAANKALEAEFSDEERYPDKQAIADYVAMVADPCSPILHWRIYNQGIKSGTYEDPVLIATFAIGHLIAVLGAHTVDLDDDNYPFVGMAMVGLKTTKWTVILVAAELYLNKASGKNSSTAYSGVSSEGCNTFESNSCSYLHMRSFGLLICLMVHVMSQVLLLLRLKDPLLNLEAGKLDALTQQEECLNPTSPPALGILSLPGPSASLQERLSTLTQQEECLSLLNLEGILVPCLQDIQTDSRPKPQHLDN
ncbi:hypothetical protein BYT27DRAFT_7210872 [Phlegmacium glaucopus]|nr:hypothetical protein BYT27DRAFT_7210872 [Phlegmacium glaucopus]